jgi:hypothetical protein
MKIGSIQENAGILHQPGREVTLLGSLDDALLASLFELPLIGRELLGDLFNLFGIVFIDEMCAVAATTLDEFGGVTGQDTLAAAPKDARPIAFEPGDVESKRAMFSLALETKPFVSVKRQ